jgi:DNA-binding MltR family transcriptional regulator
MSDDVFELQASMYAETDRGSALLAAAFLEARLEDLLQAFFVDTTNVADDLLEGTGGLATFSARIDLHYLLGLIAPLARRDLHLIRRIRNDFAHTPTDLGFDHPPIAARCSELTHDIMQQSHPPRKKFQRVVLAVCGAIQGKLLTCGHQTEQRDANLNDPELQPKAKSLAQEVERDQLRRARPDPPRIE